MANSYIQLPADANGKRLRTIDDDVEGEQVHTQIVDVLGKATEAKQDDILTALAALSTAVAALQTELASKLEAGQQVALDSASLAALESVNATVSGAVVVSNLPADPAQGLWGYHAGTSGTLTLTGGKRVLQITAIALEAAASLTINGGNTVLMPYGSSDRVSSALCIEPKGNLTDPTLLFTGTDSWFVEYVSG